ncbi:YesL family protein [Alkalicoccus daliensis]|uniref:Uncharacterized membrane protein YesL n=1 Tax=Alkalicoccus daliensis TaxID=745820 RepID=A0A1H0EZI5_9BACI|nr:DUF624 domain-containing protein [Alkalicoccus daliensis]SDN87719.1 Uncharacterized membrane protein YesL [Alkalicoccus daliensis]
MRKFSTGFYEFFEKLMNLAIWNTIWVLFTVLGLGIFGWAPATAALFAVLRKEKMEAADFPKLKTFFSIYKSEFVRANIVGFFILFGGLSLMFSFYTLLAADLWIRISGGAFLFIIFVLYLIVAMYIFPVLTHYKTSLKEHIRYSLMIGLAYLPHSFLIGITLIMIGYLYQAFPGIILFYFMSFPASVVLIITLKVFETIEEKNKDSLTISEAAPSY